MSNGVLSSSINGIPQGSSGTSGDALSSPLSYLGKKEEITEGRKASRVSKTTPSPPPPLTLAQGMEPPLQGVFPVKVVRERVTEGIGSRSVTSQ